MKVQGGLVALFVAGITGVALAQEEGHGMPTFAEIDADNNGQVSVAEAEKSPEVAKVFAQLDANSDGQLSTDEYAKIEVIPAQ